MDSINSGLKCEAKRQEKHLELYAEIMNLKSVVHHAESIYQRISGPVPNSTEEAKPESRPSLSDVLESGPRMIRDSVDSLHAILDQITSVLF